MQENFRLFDCLEYQLSNFPLEVTMAAKINDSWTTYNTKAIVDIVNQLSISLWNLGLTGNDMNVESADKIAIISNNRPEWLMADLAIQQIGCILVPLYPTTSSSEIQFILQEAQVKCIFVSDQILADKIIALQPQLPNLKHIISFDKLNQIKYWKDILFECKETELEQLKQYKSFIPNTHIATIIFTSGTTGVPKGVMLSHQNIVTNIKAVKECLPFDEGINYKILSFLPLNHIFEKLACYVYLFCGMSIYFAESIEKFGANLLEVKPNIFTCVPRLLEKLYEKIMTKGYELTGIKKKLFFWAVSLEKHFEYNKTYSWWIGLQIKIARKLIFSKWQQALGGQVKFLITGGAPCQPRLLRLFNLANIPIYEGYGPTENSPVITVNQRRQGFAKIGTVGLPISNTTVKITDEGEIICKGTSVMQGYYKRPDLTAETVIDGWLYTGDIGEWVDGKFLKITDRKKQLLKTSGGKYVAPQPIENKYKESIYIEQIMVIGDGRKFVSALILPNFEKLINYLNKNNIHTTTAKNEIVKLPEVVALFQREIDKFSEIFNHVEQIKKFVLLTKEWSVETGELTPKLSLKRKDILLKYAPEIEKMYAE
ncbi:MAG: long-chain fatty acid--CoA ligase [Sediminibacterium sp.]|nr:long-chain fatty acid--CoA ligase [Sediminibacterium sp.]